MEADGKQVEVTYPHLLKAAVNAFHQSIMHHGPYDVPPQWQLSCPMKVMCIWPQGEIWTHANQCLFICDTAAVDRLQTAIRKVKLINRGFVWPHVNLAIEPPAMEWLMFRADVGVSSQSGLLAFAKEWFVIQQDFQDIMEYVACLHNLVPTRSTVTLLHQVGALSAESSLSGISVDVSLTSIILSPGDAVTSFSQYSHPEVHDNPLSHSSSIYTKYLHGNVSTLMDAELKYHSVMNEAPDFLQSLISCIHEYRIQECSRPVESLDIEENIKEEPLTFDGISCQENLMNDLTENPSTVMNSFTFFANKGKDTMKNLCLLRRRRLAKLRRLPAKGLLTSKEEERKVQYPNKFEKLLQCPSCPCTFKLGDKGIGLSLIMSHVYEHHPRLTSFCTAAIKRRYAALIRDIEDCGCGSHGEGEVCQLTRLFLK